MYVPIFKGKLGEFQAWSHATATVHERARPIFEVVPEEGARSDLVKFLKHTDNNWPRSQVLTYDVGALNPGPVEDSGPRPVQWLSDRISELGIRACPVVRLDDDPATIADAAAADGLHNSGVCIRVGSEESRPDVESCTRDTPELLTRLGVEVAAIDLLCDLREVDSDHAVDLVEPIATSFLDWADGRSWRSVTVASGAFPASLTNFQTGPHTPVHRYDADLWQRLARRSSTPDFGDYSVAHPSMPASGQGRPNPNLRYTNGDDWWIWRERKDLPGLPGYESMRAVCRRVVASPAYHSADFSWGDSEVLRVANGNGPTGTGNASSWRAWGSSQHLAVVTDRLATLNVP